MRGQQEAILELAYEKTRSKAEQGDMEAQYKLGVWCEEGLHCLGKSLVDKDEGAAVGWFLKAAEQGHEKAQCSLAGMYYDGRGTDQSFEEAAKWCLRGAEQGNAVAQFRLGMSYGHGWGVERCQEEEVRWYRESAEQGFAPAQFNMGVLYATGAGVPQSYGTALGWYTKAAEQGYRDAAYNLALLYYNKVTPSDPERAHKWFEVGAEYGHTGAQFNTGVTFLTGQGVEKDFGRAYVWFTLAERAGHQEAGRARLAAAKQLSASAIAEADAMVAQWAPRPEPSFY